MRISRVIIIVIVVIVLSVTGFFVIRTLRTDTSSSGDHPTTSSITNGAQSSPPVPPPKTYSVKVYFSRHPESDNDPSAVFAVNRTSAESGVGSFGIAELLRGPTTSEKMAGYFASTRLRSGESNCSGRDFTLSITSGTATLRFCRQFDHLGVVTDGQAENEIKATLKQFGSVQKVVILNRNGSCEFDLSGMNLCLQ